MGITRRPGRKTGGGGAVMQKATFDTGRKKEVGVSDLTLLSSLTNEAITDNLKIRFQNGLIYTYIGHVLISVNPFQDLGIYTEQVLESYKGRNRLEVPPHVFAIAESMYYNMKSYDENQCVIISGESGAGKTEAAKRIMQYIASASGQSTSAISQIKDMVLATNPLLEAFGCAKTLRNDNSSRHGKYLEILFNQQSEPVGAHITNYLLEKNRVVGQLRGERNFHIFYQFTKGAPSHYREQFGIQTPESYTYTSRSQTTSVPGVDDVKEFQETLKVMDIIGLAAEEKDNIFRVLASILWIGNIDFIEDDSSVTVVSDPSVPAYAAYLLGVQGPDLEKALTTKVVESRFGSSGGESFESPLNRVQALAARDTLAKAIYNNLFEWIVSRVNQSLLTQGESKKSVGILDIYGFEIFENNSFEQICINYVNEKLQQIFIQLTLKAEQDEYVAERIKWTPIDYFDNKVVCDLIEELRPPGIFSVLNDSNAMAHADSVAADQSFAMKLSMLEGNRNFENRAGKFIIKHYAGDVEYDVDGMTDKNKDQLSKSITRLIAGSQDPFFVNQLFPDAFEPEDSGAGRRKRRATASDKIKQSANLLMDTLAQSRPSYIRTIKPNQNRSPSEFNDHAVLHQVKYLGLQENVRIRRAGFAYRAPFDQFVQRFFLLSSKTGYAGDYVWEGDIRDAAIEIMGASGIPQSEYQFGVTKIFIKTPETLFALEHMRDMYWYKMAARIQKAWRNKFARRLEATKVLQHAARSFLGVSYHTEIIPPDDSRIHGRKERRRFSLLAERSAFGDYLVCNDRSGSAGGYLVSTVGIKGDVIFSSRGEQLFSKLGRSSQRLTRTFILTPNTFYTVRGDLLQGRLVYTIERTVELGAISGISISPFRDDWFFIHTVSKQTSDLMLNTIFKTELIGLLNKPINVSPTIQYMKKPGKMSTIKFVKDQPQSQLFDLYKSSTVHMGPGLPPSSEREDPLPAKKATSSAPKPKPPVSRGTNSSVATSASQQRSAHAVPQVSQQYLQTSGIPPSRQARVGPIEGQKYGEEPSQSYQQPQQQSYEQPAQSQTFSAPSVPPPPPPPAPPSKPTATVLYSYPGGESYTLSVTAGQTIIVEEQDTGNGWTLAKLQENTQPGYVPTSYIQVNSSSDNNQLAQGLAQALNQQQEQGHAMASDLAAALRQQ